jgi:hypothetical protein
MPPQSRNGDEQAEQNNGMRRVTSESEISQSGDTPKEYHVKRSSLIGYV